MKYHYEILGTAADKQTWTITGSIITAKQGDFANVPSLAMREAFMKLTQGKAVYGKPGKGCSGPYHIVKLTIEEASHRFDLWPANKMVGDDDE